MTGTLLIDVDSTIPNLALMHVSTWKKTQGIPCGFTTKDPDEIYASVVFDWNKHKVDGLRFIYPEAKINTGGSGISLTTSLPEEVDLMYPDYSLYPGMDYDLGFTSRGCDRGCPFCVVTRKEGKFRINQHPKDFHDPSHKSVMLLDNNILLNKDWFFTVTNWILDEGLSVDFNQGLDLRLMDPEVAKQIAKLKPKSYWRFAFDSMSYKDSVVNGITMLKDAGVNVRHNSMVYVYCDGPEAVPDAVARCNILRDLQVMPYPMFNRHAKRSKDMTNLKRWARAWIFFSTGWDDYCAGVRGAKS